MRVNAKFEISLITISLQLHGRLPLMFYFVIHDHCVLKQGQFQNTYYTFIGLFPSYVTAIEIGGLECAAGHVERNTNGESKW